MWDPNDKRLFPVEDYREWLFRNAVDNQAPVMAIHPGLSTMYMGHEGAEIIIEADPNDVFLRHSNSSVERILSSQLKEGHGWDVGYGTQMVYHYAGTVTVKAGTFQGCWRTDWSYDANDLYTTFCPGIGPVRYKSHQYYDLELESVNFKE